MVRGEEAGKIVSIDFSAGGVCGQSPHGRDASLALVRQQGQELCRGLIGFRVAKFRRNLRQRRQHKPALGQARVGQRQLLAGYDAVPHHQQIEIQRGQTLRVTLPLAR